MAVFTSPPKKSLPFTFTLVTLLPWAFTLPSLSTSTPGNFFNRSSTTAPSLVLKASARYSTVSSLTIMGALCTITSSNNLPRGAIITVPMLMVFSCCFTGTNLATGAKPLLVIITEKFDGGTTSKLNSPFSLVKV